MSAVVGRGCACSCSVPPASSRRPPAAPAARVNARARRLAALPGGRRRAGRARWVAAAAKPRDDDPGAPAPRAPGHLPGHAPAPSPITTSAPALESGEEEDPIPDGLDPSLLPALGLSLEDFLKTRLAQAKQDLRARYVGAAAWGCLAAGGFVWLGGLGGYFRDSWLLTAGGAHESNATFVWMLALAYFATKGAAMTAVTSVRAHLFEARASAAMGGQGPAAAGKKDAGAAWLRWRDARWRREAAVVRAFVEFAASSAALAALVYSSGGADAVQLQIETLDEGALCRLTVFMWLFWESYLAGMAGMGAGGRAACAEAQLKRLEGLQERREERRRARVERLRRGGAAG